jgi:hypothetical protein
MKRRLLSYPARIFGLIAPLALAMSTVAQAQNNPYQMEQHTPGPPGGWAPEQHIPGPPGQINGSFQQQQQSNSWAQQQADNQRMQAAALAQQAQQAPSPQVQQYERWKQEWYQQHPNEPLPIMPVLEKMHRGEIIQNMNNGFAQMRQRRQEELQRNYQMSKQHQEQINASQHVTWTAAQWKNWDTEYDRQQQQQAQDYLDNIKKAGEMQREEWRHQNGVY